MRGGAAKSPQYSREREGVLGIVPIVLAAAAQPAGLGTGAGQGERLSLPGARDGIRDLCLLTPGWILPMLGGRGGHSVFLGLKVSVLHKI